MSEKKLNNTIYLMHMCTQLYLERTGIIMQEFLKLDKKGQWAARIYLTPDSASGVPFWKAI